MRVRMLTSSAGPAGNRSVGQEYDVSDEEGRALCEGHYAVPVVVDPVERAMVEAPEVRADVPRDGSRKRRGR